MTITVKAVEAAKAADKGYKLADTDGLYLFVTPAGGKSWRANYIRSGKQATRTYGQWPAISLAGARKAHAAARAIPLPDTMTANKGADETFAAVSKRWLKIKLPSLSNGKHQIQVAETLERYAMPAIGSKAINSIKRADLVSVVRAIDATGKTETAHRVAGRIAMVFNFAQDEGLIESHPAAGLCRVLSARVTKTPMASIDPAHTGELLRAIDGYPETITRLALQLLAYTFTRVGELRGMRWDELREDHKIWLVSAERMKRRLPHVVPLSPQARAILRVLEPITGHSEYVLESPIRPRHPVSENTFLFALYRLGYRGKMTAHGFRALASTVLNEKSSYPPDVIERQLAHKETDAVRAAYNRAEYLAQRRELMDWWADWLDSQRLASPALATA